jgi:SagB-type dehydrogenase family enzyme
MKSTLIVLVIMGILTAAGATTAQVAETINLPAPALEKSKPLMQALQERKSGREFQDKALTAQDLSSLLWCANGINRPESGNRTSPSARNRQDVAIYVVLKEGIYLYEPKKNQLLLVVAGDFRKSAGTQDYVATAPVNLIYVSDLSKLDFYKDREETVLTAGIDAGHCSQNVYLYAASAGLSTVVRTSVDRKKMTAILKLKPEQLVVMGQTVGYPK